MAIVSNNDGHKYLEGTNSKGLFGQYRLSDKATYRSTPEQGTNYPFGFKSGYLRTILPEFQPYASYDDYIVTPKNSINDKESTELSLNTQASIPSNAKLGMISSEDSTIQELLSKFETNDIMLKAIDKDIEKNYGAKAWGTKVGLPLAAGAAAATVGAYTLPWLWGAAGSEITGGLNLWNGYNSFKNLVSENGILKTKNLFDKKDYEGMLYSGYGDIFDASSIILPGLALGKNLSKLLGLGHPIETIKAISDNRFRPLMTFSDRRRYLTDLENKIKFETKPFVEKILAQNFAKRESKEIDRLATDNILYTFGKPKLKRDIILEGYYRFFNDRYNGDHRIHLAYRNNSPYLFPHKEVLDAAAHEFGHHFLMKYPVLSDATLPLFGYHGLNPSSKFSSMFSPISKYQHGEWVGSPKEIQSELYRLHNKFNTNDLLKTHPDETFEYMMNRFNIQPDESERMVREIIENGYYKLGGKLNGNT